MIMKLGLIGFPVQHSKSPWIHQHFLDQLGLTGRYHLIEIEPDQFVAEINRLKTSDLTGFNITIPYKEKIIPFLDGMSPEAEAIGAVNTVVCQNQKWYGHNTDGLGLITALKVQFPDLFTGGKTVLLLGAGGASRGIYHALLQENFSEIMIANRTVERAQMLLKLNQTSIKGEAISFAEAEERLAEFDLVIQTTSVGMSPDSDSRVIDLDRLKKDTVVSDIVYQPFWTSLLKEAKAHGGRVHHGHEMLIYQAKLAFELWTQQSVDAKPLLERFNQD
ncbi:shikimate dehydrogenase [Amphibacillus indicireducens]